MMDAGVRARLKAVAKGQVLWDCPLREYTSLAIGGPATALIIVENVAELQALLIFFREERVPWRIIGKGTNVLVSDAGFAGVILLLGTGFAEIASQETVDTVHAIGSEVIIKAGAACSLARLVAWCTDHSLAGIEIAVGIPGTIGGAVVMNAGAWGGDMAAVVHSVSFVDPCGQMHTRLRSELSFGYRIWHEYQRVHEKGNGDWVLLGVELCCKRANQQQIRERCQGYHHQRQAKQPKGEASAGSFFKNPPGDAAGRLIESCGLKGLQVGGAKVSPVHANFIVNCGGATAGQVIALMEKIQRKVREESGILLEPEVHFLGW